MNIEKEEIVEKQEESGNKFITPGSDEAKAIKRIRPHKEELPPIILSESSEEKVRAKKRLLGLSFKTKAKKAALSGEATYDLPVSAHIRRKIIYGCIILFIILISVILRRFEVTAEFMARTFNRYTIFITGHLTSWFPFSLFEFLFIIFVILCIVCIVITIKRFIKRKYLKGFCILTNLLLASITIVSAYVLTTSTPYNRKPMPMIQYEEEISGEEVLEIAKYYINELNELASTLKHTDDGLVDMSEYYTFNQLSKKMREEFKRLDDDYFSAYTPISKPILNSWFLSEMQVTGITFSLTGESNINRVMPSVEIPLTMAHELAHTKGVMREDDANLLSYYICATSSDPFIRYSGLFYASSRLLSAVYYSNPYTTYVELYNTISPIVSLESSSVNKYWSEHDALDKIQTWFNDLYLKSNGVENGVASYIDSEDATKTDDTYDDGSAIYTVEYSSIQKMFFALYKEKD